MKKLRTRLPLLPLFVLLIACGAQDLFMVREIHSTWTPQYSSVIQYFSMSSSSFSDGSAFASQVGESASVKNPNGTGMSSTAGTVNLAVRFDGIDDRIVVPFIYSLNNLFSVSAWVNPSAFGTEHCVITSKDESPARGFSLCLNGGGFAVAMLGQGGSAGNWSTATGTTALLAGIWTHLALTYDGANLRLYKDGVMEASPISLNALNIAKPTYIGAGGTENSPSATSFFVGNIDEVAVWNSVLSQPEVEKIHAKQKR
ncbi:MAG: LamG domain-containing protein [Bdellovibrionaceae bacterium]|nr:LamG domain-containing protein [Pseudobdellovibrionaceae bacterium]